MPNTDGRGSPVDVYTVRGVGIRTEYVIVGDDYDFEINWLNGLLQYKGAGFTGTRDDKLELKILIRDSYDYDSFDGPKILTIIIDRPPRSMAYPYNDTL